MLAHHNNRPRFLRGGMPALCVVRSTACVLECALRRGLCCVYRNALLRARVCGYRNARLRADWCVSECACRPHSDVAIGTTPAAARHARRLSEVRHAELQSSHSRTCKFGWPNIASRRGEHNCSAGRTFLFVERVFDRTRVRHRTCIRSACSNARSTNWPRIFLGNI